MSRGPIAGVGTHDWSHPAVAERGTNEWVVRFEGTSFALVQLRGPIEIAIDNQSLRALNPLMERSTLPIADGLPDGEHSAVVGCVHLICTQGDGFGPGSVNGQPATGYKFAVVATG